jgi:hypothetical protein
MDYFYFTIPTHNHHESRNLKQETFRKAGFAKEYGFYDVVEVRAKMEKRGGLKFLIENILKEGDSLYATEQDLSVGNFNDSGELFLNLNRRKIILVPLNFEFPNPIKSKQEIDKTKKKIKQSRRKNIVPDISKLLKENRQKYSNLPLPHRCLLIGQEFYFASGKAIKAISESTYYRANNLLEIKNEVEEAKFYFDQPNQKMVELSVRISPAAYNVFCKLSKERLDVPKKDLLTKLIFDGDQKYRDRS